jgi:hypothetical protein
MQKLSKFKVLHNSLIYGDYSIIIRPKKIDTSALQSTMQLQFIVEYKQNVIFTTTGIDSLEDVVDTIFELEKDDSIYKDTKQFNETLQKIIKGV